VEQRDAATDLDGRDKDVEAQPFLGWVLLETLRDLFVHRWLAGSHIETVRVQIRAGDAAKCRGAKPDALG
jgi:hypothetical protein